MTAKEQRSSEYHVCDWCGIALRVICVDKPTSGQDPVVIQHFHMVRETNLTTENRPVGAIKR